MVSALPTEIELTEGLAAPFFPGSNSGSNPAELFVRVAIKWLKINIPTLLHMKTFQKF